MHAEKWEISVCLTVGFFRILGTLFPLKSVEVVPLTVEKAVLQDSGVAACSESLYS